MKKLFPVILAFTLLASFAFAAAHQAILTWTAPADANSTSGYNVYRANATCPASGIGTLTWTKLTSTPIAALTYTDTTVTPGQWCFYITQTQGTLESVPSGTAGGTVLPNSPSITIVIN